jgi:hypothetical protein
MYEFFCLTRQLGTHFLVRTYVDRLAIDGKSTIEREIGEQKIRGIHKIELHSPSGEPDSAPLELKFCWIRVLPPIASHRLGS